MSWRNPLADGSTMPSDGEPVLGANLNCSESRISAVNALATGRPEGLYLGLQPLGAKSSAPSDPAPFDLSQLGHDRVEPGHDVRGRGHGRYSRSSNGCSRGTAFSSWASRSEQKCVGLCHRLDATPALAARIRRRSIAGRAILDSIAASNCANSRAQANDRASGALAAVSAKSSNAATSSS